MWELLSNNFNNVINFVTERRKKYPYLRRILPPVLLSTTTFLWQSNSDWCVNWFVVICRHALTVMVLGSWLKGENILICVLATSLCVCSQRLSCHISLFFSHWHLPDDARTQCWLRQTKAHTFHYQWVVLQKKKNMIQWWLTIDTVLSEASGGSA